MVHGGGRGLGVHWGRRGAKRRFVHDTRSLAATPEVASDGLGIPFFLVRTAKTPRYFFVGTAPVLCPRRNLCGVRAVAQEDNGEPLGWEVEEQGVASGSEAKTLRARDKHGCLYLFRAPLDQPVDQSR